MPDGSVLNAPAFSLTWFRHVRRPTGLRMPFTASELAAWWTEHPAPVPDDKRALPVYCAATFGGDRRALERVERATALVFDFDGAERAMRDILSMLPIACLGHTTWSHLRKPGHCFRVFVPVDRPMTVREHGRLWAWFADIFRELGAPIDTATKDASRAWFVPCGVDGYDAHAELGRDVLDVDEALTLAPSPHREERARQGGGVTSSPSVHPGRAPVLTRASRYLANMPPAIQGSGGSNATLRAAIALVRGFALEPAAALQLLAQEYNPRCRPPWALKDLERKVNEAARAARVGLGYLLTEGAAS